MKTTEYDRDNLKAWAFLKIKYGGDWPEIAKTIGNLIDDAKSAEAKVEELRKVNSDVAHMVGRLVERVSLLETTLENSAKTFDKLGLILSKNNFGMLLMNNEAAYSAATHAAQVCREVIIRSKAMEK